MYTAKVFKQRWPFAAAAVMLILPLLGCVLTEPLGRTGVARLPTLTRTPLPSLTPTTDGPDKTSTPMPLRVTPTPSIIAIAQVQPTILQPSPSATTTAPPSTATATPIPPPPSPSPTSSPTSSPTATPSPTPPPPDWSFSGVRSFFDPDQDGLLLHGELTNNTGVAQNLVTLTGTFFDAQGQVVANGAAAEFYTPIEVIPPNALVPFEIMVPGLENAATFDLQVEAQPANNSPRQDFTFLDVSSVTEDGYYCLTGELANSGQAVDSLLVIVAILFDAEDQVLNFGDYYDYAPEELLGDQTHPFDLCVDTLGHEVGRAELRAWGGKLTSAINP